MGGWYWPARRWWRLAAAVAVTVFALAVVSPHASRHHAHVAVTSGRVAVIVFGLLMATVACGELIGMLTRRLVQDLKPPEGETTEELAHAGRLIGWLERALIYGAVLAGHPEAAALVVAVKSLARLGELRSGPFVEYFLIGTLASLLCAFAVAEAVLALTTGV